MAVLWLVSLAEELVHWLVALPPTLAYAATSYPSYFRSYLALQQDFSATLLFLHVPKITVGAALLALAVTAAAVRRKQGAARQASGAV